MAFFFSATKEGTQKPAHQIMGINMGDNNRLVNCS